MSNNFKIEISKIRTTVELMQFDLSDLNNTLTTIEAKVDLHPEISENINLLPITEQLEKIYRTVSEMLPHPNFGK